MLDQLGIELTGDFVCSPASRKPYQQHEAYRFGNAMADDWEGKVHAYDRLRSNHEPARKETWRA